jgi:hypothetical protein
MELVNCNNLELRLIKDVKINSHKFILDLLLFFYQQLSQIHNDILSFMVGEFYIFN